MIRLTTSCSGRSAARPAAEPERYTRQRHSARPRKRMKTHRIVWASLFVGTLAITLAACSVNSGTCGTCGGKGFLAIAADPCEYAGDKEVPCDELRANFRTMSPESGTKSLVACIQQAGVLQAWSTIYNDGWNQAASLLEQTDRDEVIDLAGGEEVRSFVNLVADSRNESGQIIRSPYGIEPIIPDCPKCAP